LNLFAQYCHALQPKVAVPFAGQYWLHGEQLDLNPLRGMADATECHPYNMNVWVPADGGQSTLTIQNQDEWEINSYRDDPYDWPTVRQEVSKLDSPGFLGREAWMKMQLRYEREIMVPVERLPLLKLLQSAVDNAYNQFRSHNRQLNLCIKTQLPQWFVMTNYFPVVGTTTAEHVATLEPRVEVRLDARYLFGMLTRLYNANSVRIGSLCQFKCVPNVYDKELDDLFGEFWDSLRV
jgi:hypothetical protein